MIGNESKHAPTSPTETGYMSTRSPVSANCTSPFYSSFVRSELVSAHREHPTRPGCYIWGVELYMVTTGAYWP